jgi:ATP-dependent DNA helicase MPH1
MEDEGDGEDESEDESLHRRPFRAVDFSSDTGSMIPRVLSKLPAAKHLKPSKSGRRRPVFDRNNAFVTMEADLSGDDCQGGSTDTEGEEDQYDRDFVRDSDEDALGMLDSDDQLAIYQQGLQTQAPMKFASRPVRVGEFGFNLDRPLPPRHGFRRSSSPIASDEPNDYELGSFIVEDEEDLEEDSIR